MRGSHFPPPDSHLWEVLTQPLIHPRANHQHSRASTEVSFAPPTPSMEGESRNRTRLARWGRLRPSSGHGGRQHPSRRTRPATISPSPRCWWPTITPTLRPHIGSVSCHLVLVPMGADGTPPGGRGQRRSPRPHAVGGRPSPRPCGRT
jgi:hypothetical protein